MAHIKDSKDLTSISRASPDCARILQPSKPTWLFHLILPHITKYISKAAILNCRAACSQWRECVSKRLETSQDLEFQNKFSFSPKTNMSLSGFCYAMKNHSGNPFPARCVDFRQVSGGRLTAGYWIHVLEFLTNFGEHVWTCSFDFGNARFDLFVVILRQCLTHLKNVSKLRINWKFDDTRVMEERMTPDLEEPRFPRMEKLDHLELSGLFSRLFYEKVVISLYSGQLKTLKADGIFS